MSDTVYSKEYFVDSLKAIDEEAQAIADKTFKLWEAFDTQTNDVTNTEFDEVFNRFRELKSLVSDIASGEQDGISSYKQVSTLLEKYQGEF